MYSFLISCWPPETGRQPAPQCVQLRPLASYFFGYAIFVVPMVPLNANGAWS